jgi:hypothetical protein
MAAKKTTAILEREEFREGYEFMRREVVVGRPIADLTKEELIALCGVLKLSLQGINDSFRRKLGR